jgi:threonine dehydratase
MSYFPKVKDIVAAHYNILKIMGYTLLQKNVDMSNKYNSNIYLKREDLTPVKSYKIRGAFNKMSSLEKSSKIVTASAGNHAQGVSFSSNLLNMHSDIFMPKITPKQKIDKVIKFGGCYTKIYLEGNNFDETSKISKEFMESNKSVYVHPFDDKKVIEGQGTVGFELLNQLDKIDYIILPIGGGGLASGVSSFIKQVNPLVKIIGVEPMGAASMYEAVKQKKIVTLDKLDTFVDGAAVKRVGELNFNICKETLDDIIIIDEGHVCTKILEMYNQQSYIFEPAGVLSLCALDILKPELKNKNVVCIISGGNSDVFRMTEILERSLIYEGLKHYFRIQFPQKAGMLKEFITSILGKDDDIIYFRYEKIVNKEMGPVILGIEVKKSSDIINIIDQMKKNMITYEKLENKDLL